MIMSVEPATATEKTTARDPSSPVSERVGRLLKRAWEGDFCPRTEERAEWSRDVLHENRTLPRKLQIALLLEAVCERVPVHIAPDELVIGCRTVSGWPEIDEAIDHGSAEPGYMIADYATVVNLGILSIIERCEKGLAELDEARPNQAEQVITLRSMIIACRATIRLAERYADECLHMAARESSPTRRAELEELARICRKVPAHPAETLQEAIQSVWLTHIAVYLECDNCGFALGRLDQYLNPFYVADLEAGRTDANGAQELMECLWIKIYENVRGDIMHAQTVTVGGLTPDGRDGVNQMSWIILRAVRDMATVGPSVAIRVHQRMPKDVIAYVLQTMCLGSYMPQFYNDEQMVSALSSYGIPPEDARDYGIIGCHEPTICGKAYSRPASWPGYFCIPMCLELALGNGCTLDTGKQSGPQTGDPVLWERFEDLWKAFHGQLRHMVREKVIASNRGEVVKRQMMPRPLMSALIGGCIEKGLDFTEGGALYNSSGFQGFGIGTCADSLAVLRKLCFEDRELPVRALIEILKRNWDGQEELRLRIKKTFPHYGNDDDTVDELAVSMIRLLQAELDRYTNIRGGPFILGLWSFTSHVWSGKEMAASADGRRRGEALSHSMGPMQGCGMAGPTAVLRSASKIDTSRMANGGSLLLEFQSSLLRSQDSLDTIRSLIQTYFTMGGIQVQLSAVSPEMLEAAMKEPEKYQHLVVRVAGYCDFFVRLSKFPELQSFIIAREKYAGV
ncbi:MAG: pyruvate formate lyase family protein [Candidatus Latescibacterota bacterium]